MTKEALKLALEALELSAVTVDSFGVQKKTNEAITAIKEALAEQPAQQEPVCDKDPQGCWSVRCQLGKQCKNTPPQRTWAGLTDEEVEMLVKNQRAGPREQIRYIEAKLRSKNEH